LKGRIRLPISPS